MSTSDRLRRMCEDDDLVGDIARELVEEDPDAPPSVNRARLRFTGAEIRSTLSAAAKVLEARNR